MSGGNNNNHKNTNNQHTESDLGARTNSELNKEADIDIVAENFLIQEIEFFE